MKERRVRFTETAVRHVKVERNWWLANRDYRELFATQLESAVRLVALLPGAGTTYEKSPIRDLRRVYIPKLACHLYYTFNDDEVIVRALWGAKRDRGPFSGT